MRRPQQGGPLQKAGVRLTKEDGEALAKTNDAAKAILNTIGSSTASSTTPKSVPGNYRATSGRMA